MIIKTEFSGSMKIPILLGVLLVAGFSPTEAQDGCRCVDEWTSTLPKRIKAFKDPPPVGKYEYTGVLVGVMDSFFKPCTCVDVVRMTMKVTIKDQELYTQASADSSVAQGNVSQAVMNMVPAMETFNTMLENRIESVYPKYLSSASPDKSTYDLEFILRGTNTSHVPNMVVTALTDQAVGLVDFPGGFTHTPPISIAECSGTPAASPSGTITRVWNGDTVPPTEATYECADGEYVTPLGKGKVTCQHDTLTWSALETIQCTSGCGGDPPTPPMNSYMDWDGSSRAIGDIVNYACKFGHKSGDGKNESSECTVDDGWTELQQTYYCKEEPCLEDIPQVPAHGFTNLVDTKREAGTEVTYFCQAGYVPSNKKEVTITCNLGSWSSLPDGWDCVNSLALSLAQRVKGDVDLPESQLTAEEKQRKMTMIEEPNYFFLVTVPSIIALVICMVICLCCTKINSPLFNICRGYTGGRKQNYMKHHYNN